MVTSLGRTYTVICNFKSYIEILLVNRLPRMMNKTLLTNDARGESRSHSDSPLLSITLR